MSGGLTVSQGLERGLAAHAAGHLQDAAKLYEAILKVRPDYVPAWNGLGVLHLQTRQTAEGLRCFDEACRIHRAPHLVHNIAVALERLGREDEALAAYGEALAALPHAAASHWRLSLLLARCGDAAAAEHHRRHALASSDHFPPPAVDGTRKVIEALTGSGPVQVVMGGHWTSHDGWLVLDQLDQDIGWPSLFHTASVDAVFCEHVIEHVPFAEAVGFLAELRRVLKPGGCLRLLCPMVEKLMETQTDADAVRLYSGNSFSVFETERHLLRDRLRLGDLDRYFKTFQLNSMFRFWGHRFIWSAELLCDVLTASGFDRTAIVEIGQGTRPDLALERRARGLYTGNDWRADRALNHVFDPESLVIEAFC